VSGRSFDVLIVDDEPLARERVAQLLAAHADFRVVGEAGDGAAAIDAITALRPDAVFLDVQMPGLDGFAVLEALPADRRPAIVFVTAFDEHALRAFEVSAIDYLVKPVDRDRFVRTVERLRGRNEAAEATALAALLATLRADRSRPARFVTRDARGYYFVAAADVEWIEAQDNYIALHAGGKEHLVRDTLRAVEERLDPARFVRVHRSALVNLDFVARIEPQGSGAFTLVLRDGSSLTSSRSYNGLLRERLGLG
jgi:two-component system LytT family response regulator